jgi:hypothetical protein
MFCLAFGMPLNPVRSNAGSSVVEHRLRSVSAALILQCFDRELPVLKTRFFFFFLGWQKLTLQWRSCIESESENGNKVDSEIHCSEGGGHCRHMAQSMSREF